MSKLKKAAVIYLVVSSVILHVIAAWILISFGSAIKSGFESANEFAKAAAGQAKDVGTIKDISTLKDGDHSYVGYAVDYKGQMLYVMGVSENLKKCDTVAVNISKHPYAPLKSLIVTVMKNGP
jgi:hypothetical protein